MAEKRLGKGTLYILFGKVAMIGLSTISAILIPRFLGPKAMGFYSYWLAVYFILGMTFNFAAPPIINRYLPELRRLNPLLIRPLIKNTLKIKLPLIFFVLLAGWWFFSKQRVYFLIILLASVTFALSTTLICILYAYKEMKFYIFLQFSQRLAKLFFIFSFFTFFKEMGIILAILLAPLLVILISISPVLRLLPPISGNLNGHFKTYLSFGLWIYLGGLFQTLTNWLAPVLSKEYITDLTIVGYLGLGIQICFQLTNLINSISEGIFPSLIEFHVIKDERFKNSLEISWKYTNMILFPIVAGILILIKPAICLLIGEGFLPSVAIIYILLPTICFTSLNLIHQHILLAYERQFSIFIAYFMGSLAFFICTIYSIKTYGIIGVSLSISLGSLISFILLNLFSIRFEKVERYYSHLLKPLLASMVMGILISLIRVSNVFFLLIAILVGIIAYIGLMWLIRGIDVGDIKRLKKAFFET